MHIVKTDFWSSYGTQLPIIPNFLLCQSNCRMCFHIQGGIIYWTLSEIMDLICILIPFILASPHWLDLFILHQLWNKFFQLIFITLDCFFGSLPILKHYEGCGDCNNFNRTQNHSSFYLYIDMYNIWLSDLLF